MNIVFVVVVQFPYGSASSMRARSLYRLFEMAGHNVHVISDFDTVPSYNADIAYSYEAIFDKEISFNRIRLAPHKCLARLREYCNNHKVDCILTNARADRFNSIATWCKNNNIKLIVESCEWYDHSIFKFGILDPRFIKNQLMIKNNFKKADGFISISRLLDEHNKSFGKMSVRVPTILDVMNTEFSVRTDNEKCVIVYTGNPGKSKELFHPVFRVLAENEYIRRNTEFHIYGPDKKSVLENIENDSSLLERAGEAVMVHGKVPQQEIEGIVRSADYMLFLRPKRRSSDAGFPTKLGESFAVGTPVITNDTGDIALYVQNEVNGFIVDLNEQSSLEMALLQAIDMKEKEYSIMRQNARRTAEEAFDFRSYKDKIDELIDSINRS